jgi:metal-responsive CopG/Arc/MetJ family transcriptional regulator
MADREARRRKTSRSEFVRDVVRTEVTKSDTLDQELELRRQRREAIEGIRRIAEEAGSWPATKIVHNWRYRFMRENH